MSRPQGSADATGRNPTKRRIGVLSEDRLMRESVRRLMRKRFEVECFESVSAFLDRPQSPEIVLLDAHDRNDSAAAQINTARPTVKIMIMNADSGRVDLVKCVRDGALGFLLEDATENNLAAAIEAVAAGNRVMPESIEDQISNQLQRQNRNKQDVVLKDANLTGREEFIVQLILEGARNADIAAKLSISEDAVESDIQQILQKLGCRTRVEILRRMAG